MDRGSRSVKSVYGSEDPDHKILWIWNTGRENVRQGNSYNQRMQDKFRIRECNIRPHFVQQNPRLGHSQHKQDSAGVSFQLMLDGMFNERRIITCPSAAVQRERGGGHLMIACNSRVRPHKVGGRQLDFSSHLKTNRILTFDKNEEYLRMIQIKLFYSALKALWANFRQPLRAEIYNYHTFDI